MPSGCCAGGECAAKNSKPVADGRHLLPTPTIAVQPDASVGLAKEIKA